MYLIIILPCERDTIIIPISQMTMKLKQVA